MGSFGLPPPPPSTDAFDAVDQLITANSWEEGSLWSATGLSAGDVHSHEHASLSLTDQQALIRELRQMRRQHAHLQEYCRALGKQTATLARRLSLMEGFFMSGRPLPAAQPLASTAPPPTQQQQPGSSYVRSSAPYAASPITQQQHYMTTSPAQLPPPTPPPAPPSHMARLPPPRQPASTRYQSASSDSGQRPDERRQPTSSFEHGHQVPLSPRNPVYSSAAGSSGSRRRSTKIDALQQQLLSGGAPAETQLTPGELGEALPDIEWDDEDEDERGDANARTHRGHGAIAGGSDSDAHCEADDQLTDREWQAPLPSENSLTDGRPHAGAPAAATAVAGGENTALSSTPPARGMGLVIEQFRGGAAPPSATDTESDGGDGWSSPAASPAPARRPSASTQHHSLATFTNTGSGARTLAAPRSPAAVARVKASGLFDNLEEDGTDSLFSAAPSVAGSQSEKLAEALFADFGGDDGDDNLFA
jgi:hypothetical protein